METLSCIFVTVKLLFSWFCDFDRISTVRNCDGMNSFQELVFHAPRRMGMHWCAFSTTIVWFIFLFILLCISFTDRISWRFFHVADTWNFIQRLNNSVHGYRVFTSWLFLMITKNRSTSISRPHNFSSKYQKQKHETTNDK